MIWYAGHYPQVNLKHLQQRMIQSGDDTGAVPLSMAQLRELLLAAIDSADISMLKADVRPFIRDQQELELWSKDFFRDVIRHFQEA